MQRYQFLAKFPFPPFVFIYSMSSFYYYFDVIRTPNWPSPMTSAVSEIMLHFWLKLVLNLRQWISQKKNPVPSPTHPVNDENYFTIIIYKRQRHYRIMNYTDCVAPQQKPTNEDGDNDTRGERDGCCWKMNKKINILQQTSINFHSHPQPSLPSHPLHCELLFIVRCSVLFIWADA